MNNRIIKGRPGIIKGKFQPAINQSAEDKTLETKQKIEAAGDTAQPDQHAAGAELKQDT
jgi:hypothetical protein